ncbi:MAG: PKD domain-containing protein [Nitrososphaerota archaeon]|jgi:hypothetical protein|nr:PKD domain-containing protein [Nitrososphaerota archaeon]
MSKNSQSSKKYFSLFLSVLLIVSAVCVFVPGVRAAELTPEQKALTLTTEVLGFDTSKYEVQVENYEHNTSMWYLGVVPQHTVAYTLISNQNSFQLLYIFANDNLQRIAIHKTGPMQERSNYFRDVDVAKNFLTKYQKYTGNSLYNQLSTMIPTERIVGNSTITSENAALEITITENDTIFKWYYTANGVVAPYSKFISIIIERGALSAFVDNWQLYPVGNTCVGISRDEALAVALEAARGHAWSLEVEASSLSVENFNEASVCWASLVFMGSVEADNVRGEYPLVLYPVWQFGLALDRWYGYMYGVEVDVWADSGEVRRVHEAWSSILPEEEAAFFAGVSDQNTGVFETGLSLTVLVMFSACVAMVSGFAVVCMGGTKKRYYMGLFRRHGFKVSSVLFCLILASTIFFGALETASATTRGAVVWGSESVEGYDSATNTNPRKSQAEITLQQGISVNISNYFLSGGYTGNSGINHQGSTGLGSLASQIKNDISTLYSSKDCVAAVTFDHGVGRPDSFPPLTEFHYMFEDQNGTVGPKLPSGGKPGNAVYDWEVYNLAVQSKTTFVFIGTCLSADATYGQGMLPGHLLVYPERAVGMPFAWTGRRVSSMNTPGFAISTHISDDGYGNPDWGNQVYMGFKGGAASLEQIFPVGSGSYSYSKWLNSFMANALTIDQSVNDALDAASVEFTGLSFAYSPLKNDFTPVWPGFSSSSISRLAVFGNGNIHLKNFDPHTVSVPSISGPTSNPVGTSNSFTVSSSVDSFGHRIRYIFDWADGTSTTTGYYNSGVPVSVSHSWSSNGVYGVRVYAQCEDGCRSDLSVPYSVAIGANPWVTVEAWDNYGNSLPVCVYVDGQLVDSAPVSFMVGAGSHCITVDWQIYIFVIFDSFSDGCNNGDYRTISSNTTITANYRCT